MLLYLFFDSLLSTCPKRMSTEKWPKAADSPLMSWRKHSKNKENKETRRNPHSTEYCRKML